MDCHETQDLLHGYLDGELDVVSSVALSQHLQGCPLCTQRYEAQRALRSALHSSSLYFSPPKTLHKRAWAAVRRTSRAETRVRWWTWRWLSVACALAASVLLLWHNPFTPAGSPVAEHVLQDVVAGHVRSLMVHHLTDVTSTDQHTVKPWFETALDFSPPVPDLTAQGFPLAGGRLDYLDKRVVAALVYRRQQHAINLFIWPATIHANSKPHTMSQQGYNLVQWTAAGMTYWAISTLNARELQEFTSMVQQSTIPAGTP